MSKSLAIENWSSDITIIRSQAESSPSRRLLLNGKRAKLWTKTCFWFAKEAVFRLSKQASISKQAHFYNFDFVQFKHYSNLPSRASPLLRNLEHEKIFKRTSMLEKNVFDLNDLNWPRSISKPSAQLKKDRPGDGTFRIASPDSELANQDTFACLLKSLSLWYLTMIHNATYGFTVSLF